MITHALPLVLLILPAGILIGWYIARSKYLQLQNLKATEFQNRMTALEQDLQEEKQSVLQLTDEKATLAQELSDALTAQSKSLKEKYDALYLKYIEVTNEKNRLKGQLNEGRK